VAGLGQGAPRFGGRLIRRSRSSGYRAACPWPACTPPRRSVHA